MVIITERGAAHEKRWERFEYECDCCGCKFSFYGMDCEHFEKNSNGLWFGIINCPECGNSNSVDLEGEEK